MKRIMKCAILCIIFCVVLSVNAFATDANTFELDELGMCIDIPTDHMVYTRNINENDPNLGVYGLTKDSLYSYMLAQNIYLDAWDEFAEHEITVTMVEAPLIENFGSLSDTTLTALTSALPAEYQNAGVTWIESEIYQHSQTKFIKIYISQPNNGDTAYGLQYYTVNDGKAISVTLRSYSRKIDAEKETLIERIMDSVHFDTVPKAKEQPVQTASFTYTDKNSGLAFNVPANWVETPMYEEREYIDAKFTSNLEEGLGIIFMSEDLFEAKNAGVGLSAAANLFADRSTMGNDLFTKADIAETIGCKEKDISMVTYGGKEYYFAEFSATGTAYGLTISMPNVCLVRIENGYLYTFQFAGASDSVYFKDFESLVNSTVYPKIEDGNTRNQIIGANVFLFYILFIIVYTLPIVVYRWIKKSPVEPKKAKRIAIIYGACIFVLILFAIITLGVDWFLGITVLLWILVNYRILVGGHRKVMLIQPRTLSEGEKIEGQAMDDQEDTPISKPTNIKTAAEEYPGNSEEKQPGETTFFVYCHRCGNKLTNGSVFCNKCGTKIPTLD